MNLILFTTDQFKDIWFVPTIVSNAAMNKCLFPGGCVCLIVTNRDLEVLSADLYAMYIFLNL